MSFCISGSGVNVSTTLAADISGSIASNLLKFSGYMAVYNVHNIFKGELCIFNSKNLVNKNVRYCFADVGTLINWPKMNSISIVSYRIR